MILAAMLLPATGSASVFRQPLIVILDCSVCFMVLSIGLVVGSVLTCEAVVLIGGACFLTITDGDATLYQVNLVLGGGLFPIAVGYRYISDFVGTSAVFRC